MGSIGTGKSVFEMQFLWEGLKSGETLSYDVMDKYFPRLHQYSGASAGKSSPKVGTCVKARPQS